jgi:Arc/MetJ family transcription regulator
MRTNIHLDDELVSRAMAVTGKTTKRALVEEGLRTLLRLHGQREVRDLRGRLRWEGEEPAEKAADVADPR